MIIALYIIGFIALVYGLMIYDSAGRCPDCGARMKNTGITETTNTWTCPRCGKVMTYTDNE